MYLWNSNLFGVVMQNVTSRREIKTVHVAVFSPHWVDSKEGKPSIVYKDEEMSTDRVG